jgi:ribosomal protein S1
VSWIESYGAFVDIELQDESTGTGLIHKSELSWNLVVVPETVVSVGALICGASLDWHSSLF